MDRFLGTITQHAMNYAIRSGIAITSTYAIRQCSRLLKAVEDITDYQELQALQERLDSKIRIISPAIDMIELIAARGNTTLQSAVALTKGLRWDIQTLGTRLANAANAEELFQRGKTKAKARPELKAELRRIVQDIQKLLLRIEDAVPLINLAITTSGASLSTSLPATVSPSRLLQASTCLTAADTKYSNDPSNSVQVGPAFTLSLYMLFVGHNREQQNERERDDIRDTTWKEVIHKARVKLIRVPSKHAEVSYEASRLDVPSQDGIGSPSSAGTKDNIGASFIPGDGREAEFAYQLEIIEDIDDGRVHSFEDGEPRPKPYEDVSLAGIRERIPIHQFSKIFYADTGKILNIGNDAEVNSPVLLFKRDLNAPHPRLMMEDSGQEYPWGYGNTATERDSSELGKAQMRAEEEDSQADIDHQLHSESFVHLPEDDAQLHHSGQNSAWRLPVDLDPEWLAFEVYTDDEVEDDDSDESQDTFDDSTSASEALTSSREPSSECGLNSSLQNLRLDSSTPELLRSPESQRISTPTSIPKAIPVPQTPTMIDSPFGPVRSSLSLLEMLIRLTALQQYKQTSHLSIPDELLNFFLFESSTSGAGMDGEQRRRIRYEAKKKVGFDPYDDTPYKKEQYHNQHPDYEHRSRGGTPYSEFEPQHDFYDDVPHWSREQSAPLQDSGSPWLLRSKDNPRRSKSQQFIPDFSSPASPYVPARRAKRPLDSVHQARRGGIVASPLGRGRSVETDSSLGTSPGTPNLGGRAEHDEED